MLNTVTDVVCIENNFINNIRVMEVKFGRTYHDIQIPKHVNQHLKLWKKTFKITLEDISMNLVTFRSTNHIIVGDEC